MKMRLLLATGISTCAAAAALLAACASDTPVPADEPDAADAASTDAASEASDDADAGPCSDCEYFPTTCTDGVLCSTGPYAPGSEGSLDMRAQINVLRGRSANDVWAVGAVGAAAHFDGTSWTRSDLGDRETLRALWLRGTGEVSFGTLANVYTRGITLEEDAAAPSPGGWSTRGPAEAPPEFSPDTARVTAAWSAPGSDWLWCTTMSFTAGATSGLWRVRVAPTGKPEVTIGIPPETCKNLPCSQLTSIHGISANDLWAVGYKGAAVRITDADGETPKMKVSNTQAWDALHAVWAASASEAWAVGAKGTIRHYTGHPLLWEIVSDVPTTEDLRAVWGSSPSDVWAVGNGAVVLHYDGTSWTRVKIAGLGTRRPNLTTVWMPSPGHVWIGGHGVILSLGGKP